MIVGAFGLKKDPFRITPDPQFFFVGATMRPGLDELAAALIGRRGLLLVLGDSGTGKTTLLRKMEADLEDAGSIALIVTQPRAGIDDILNRWAEKLGISSESKDRAQLVAAIRARRRTAGRDALAAILVDEADHCSAALLRDLVTLGESSDDGGDGIQTVLAGQKVLETRLNLEAPDVRQRVAVVTHLERLSPAEVEAYIRHRLQFAGYAGPDLFAGDLVARVAELTGGVPRLINHLCGRALVLAHDSGEEVISNRTLDEAARDCMLLGSEAMTVAPVIAPHPGAAPRAVLAEQFVARRHVATVPPPTDALDIPNPKPVERLADSQIKHVEQKRPVDPPAAKSDSTTAVSAAVAQDHAAFSTAETSSVEIPTPAVPKKRTKRAAKSHEVNEGLPPAVQPRPGGEIMSAPPLVTLIAAPAVPTDTTDVAPDDGAEGRDDDTVSAPTIAGETETVLEPPPRAIMSPQAVHVTEAAAPRPLTKVVLLGAEHGAPEGTRTEIRHSAANEQQGEAEEGAGLSATSQTASTSPIEAAAERAFPHDSPSYVPISRAAVSKLVGRRRPRASSIEAASTPQSLPSDELPVPRGPGSDAAVTSRSASASSDVSPQLEPQRRRSVLETANEPVAPDAVRSSGWLRRVAIVALLIAGSAAAGYFYLQPAPFPEAPPTTVDTTGPRVTPTPPVSASPPPSGLQASPTGIIDYKDPRTAVDPATADVVDDDSLERPALPVPKVLRLPTIDPRQPPERGANAPSGESTPGNLFPSGTSSTDAANMSTAAVDLSQLAGTVAGDRGGFTSGELPPFPLSVAPVTGGGGPEQSPRAVEASPDLRDRAPQQPAAPNISPAPASPANPAIVSEPTSEISTPTLARELTPPGPADPIPRIASAEQEADRAMASRSATSATVDKPPAVPPSMTATPDPPQSTATREATSERTEAPSASNVATAAAPANSPAVVEPPTTSAAASIPTEPAGPARRTSAGPGAVAPADAASTRVAEPTRPAAVGVVHGPSSGEFQLTQGGGGIGAEQLIARGDIYLRDGDIASARLLYEAAVRLGNAAAARRIGMTYDPIEHRRLRIIGVSPNAQRALEWYRQAMEAGDAEAQRRHAELSAWMARSGAR